MLTYQIWIQYLSKRKAQRAADFCVKKHTQPERARKLYFLKANISYIWCITFWSARCSL